MSSRHRIGLVSHEGRAWRWRMRGGAITLAEETLAWIDVNGVPDLIVVTDMIDLSAYLAMIRRAVPGVEVAIYMHENQLGYPRQPGEPVDQGLAWTTWSNLLVADAIWFNSDFHRSELFDALPGFLGGVPDHSHLHLIDSVIAKSEVVPVGVDIAAIPSGGAARPPDPAGPLVLSNHRWHHDKDVGAILRALLRLAGRDVAFRVAVVGDDQGGQRDDLMPLIERLGDRVERVGYQPRGDYLELLSRSDIVVSAARNEYFGVAVVEAVAAGAVPVLPDGLAYPEVIPPLFHDAALYQLGGLTTALESAITGLQDRRRELDGLAASMARFGWSQVSLALDDAAVRLVAQPR